MQAPRPEALMIVVGGILHVYLEARAQLAHVLVEGWLEPTGPQAATAHPGRRERPHLRQQGSDVEIRSAQHLERPRRAPALGEGRALEHDRPWIATRHPQVWRIGTGVHPGALPHRPPIAERIGGLPAFHRNHVAIDIEIEGRHEPVSELAERQAVTHRHGARADKALATGPQPQSLDRAPDRIRAVQHPY